MKIYHNQLQQTLNKGFIPVWLVFGDEPWQKTDSVNNIKIHAQQQGFSEVIRFNPESNFDWQQLIDEYQSMSLFSSQRIIEVEFSTNKIGDNGNKTLFALSEIIEKNITLQDVIFIFYGLKLDGPSANRKWFKALTKLGCYIPIYDIDVNHLPRWLQNQARRLGVNLAPDLSSLLVALFEGNLLSLEQELQKLSILFPNNQQITLQDAEHLVTKQAKFNPFQLTDSLLLGNCDKCLIMLDQMQQEGTAPGQIIWVIHKEINQLFAMLKKIEQGIHINDIYKEYRIWDKRKPLYQHALNNITLKNVQRALSRIADIDLISKTNSEFNPFILLADLCITLYKGDTTQHYSLNYEFH